MKVKRSRLQGKLEHGQSVGEWKTEREETLLQIDCQRKCKRTAWSPSFGGQQAGLCGHWYHWREAITHTHTTGGRKKRLPKEEREAT